MNLTSDEVKYVLLLELIIIHNPFEFRSEFVHALFKEFERSPNYLRILRRIFDPSYFPYQIIENIYTNLNNNEELIGVLIKCLINISQNSLGSLLESLNLNIIIYQQDNYGKVHKLKVNNGKAKYKAYCFQSRKTPEKHCILYKGRFGNMCIMCGLETEKANIIILKDCGHKVCFNCVPKSERVCPFKFCRSTIFNQDEIDEMIFSKKMKEVEAKLKNYTLPCPKCSFSIEIKLEKEPEYLKCPQCKEAVCYIHKGLISKCLCLCPKCLNSLKKKPYMISCSKKDCGFHFCLKCHQANACNCVCKYCGIGDGVNCKICQNICNHCLARVENLVTLKCKHKLCLICLCHKEIEKKPLCHKCNEMEIEK